MPFHPPASSCGTLQSEPVYRDKSGRRIDAKLELLKRQAEERAESEKLAKSLAWGQGVKQQDEKRQFRDELLKMKDAPFARYKEDAELNALLKSELRWDDPMRDQLEIAAGHAMVADSQVLKGRVSGYQGRGPPNRFNIPPGPRWDGVDRSNGFEARYFDSQSSQKALKSVAYKWSSEDL